METREKYLSLLPQIRELARSMGYAIGVHGSLERDFDLIAAPWTEDAASPLELAEAIEREVWGTITRDGGVQSKEPHVKPHGRLAWSIQIGRGRYIDLSVMPRKSEVGVEHLELSKVLEMCHRTAQQVEMRQAAHNGYGSHLPYTTARCPKCKRRKRCGRRDGKHLIDCSCGMLTFIDGSDAG